MRVFHTSDWHLGRMLYSRSLLEDQSYFIHEVFLREVEARKPDVVIISGDIYDRQIAPVEAIRLFDEAVLTLSRQGVKTAIISGNHDAADRIALMKPLLRQQGVYISTSLEDAMTPVSIEVKGERLNLFLLPHLDNAVVRDYFKDDTLRGETACMGRVLQELQTQLRSDSLNLLIAHCFVTGATVAGSESPMFVGGSGEIPASLLEAFDYVALGHLHGAQRVGKNGRYCGSPLKYSIDEEHQKKSFVELDVREGKLEYALIPIKNKRDVRRISGLFEEILQQGLQEVCEDYVEIVLEDQHPVLQAAQKLSPFYPQMLTVKNQWASKQAGIEMAERRKDADERTLFLSFMRDICNVEINKEEEELFQEILEEVMAKEAGR